jgi:HEAT repeat protein
MADLRSPDAKTRESALQKIAGGAAATARDLQDELRSLAQKDPEPAVRGAALAALGATFNPKMAPVVRAGLTDKQWQVRRGAARGLEGLCWFAAPPFIADLCRALHDPEPRVAVAAADALGFCSHELFKAAIGSLMDRMANGPNAEVRAAATRALVRHRAALPTQVTPNLLAVAREKDSPQQFKCMEALSFVGPIDDSPELAELWRQAFRDTREERCLYALFRVEKCAIALPQLMPDLDRLTASKDESIASAAIDALVECGEEGIGRVAARFAAFSKDSKYHALMGFVKYPHHCRKALPALLAALADSRASRGLRNEIAGTLFAIGMPLSFVAELKRIRADPMLDEPARKSIDELLATGREGPAPYDSKSEISSTFSAAERTRIIAKVIEEVQKARGTTRTSAVEYLAKFGRYAAPAVPALQALLQEEANIVQTDPVLKLVPNSPNQWAALETLAVIGPAAEPVVPAIVERLNATDDFGAAESLRTLGPVAVPGLITGLSNPYANTRCRCARILGEIGAASRSAEPALERATKDPVAGVRGEAAAALKRLRASAAAAAK